MVLRAVQAAELRSGDPDGEQGGCSEKGVRLAQTMQVGPRIPMIIQVGKAAAGPTFGPTWRLSHFADPIHVGGDRSLRGRRPGNTRPSQPGGSSG